MKKLIIAITILAVTAAAIFLLLLKVASKDTPNAEPKEIVTHAQDTWERALEWCESNGIKEAVNCKDLDGTPSWYSWQWKPETFLALGIKYGFLPKDTTLAQVREKMKDYELQKKILDKMILDPEIVWENQFPNCVKKLGRPPKY